MSQMGVALVNLQIAILSASRMFNNCYSFELNF